MSHWSSLEIRVIVTSIIHTLCGHGVDHRIQKSKSIFRSSEFDFLARIDDTAILPVEVWASTQHRWHAFSASFFVPLDAEGEGVGKYTYHMSKEAYTNSEHRF